MDLLSENKIVCYLIKNRFQAPYCNYNADVDESHIGEEHGQVTQIDRDEIYPAVKEIPQEVLFVQGTIDD